jgi:hypothetical protein
MFHQQIKNEVEAMEFTEKNRGAAIVGERYCKYSWRKRQTYFQN